MYNNTMNYAEQRHALGQPSHIHSSQQVQQLGQGDGQLQGQHEVEGHRQPSASEAQQQSHSNMNMQHPVSAMPGNSNVNLMQNQNGIRYPHQAQTGTGRSTAVTRLHHHVAPNNHSPRSPAFGIQRQHAFHSVNNSNHNEYSYHDPYHNNHSQPFGQTSLPSGMMKPQITTANNEAELINGSHASTTGLLSSFESSTSVSAATAIANIASLINASTSSNSLNNDGADVMQSPAPSASATMTSHPSAMYPGHAFTPAMNSGQMGSHHNYVTGNQINKDSGRPNHSRDNTATIPPSQSQQFQSARNQHNSMADKTALLQRDLEQERSLRMQLQQRVIELNQKVHSQHLVEQSYEELVQKYKMLLAQMQQMSMVIERYKNALKTLEQEKMMVYSENASLKAQENVAHDKSMLYNMLMERSKKLEEENSGLVLENETYQRKYEKCIDEISKQVVQALLTQKALQEQCLLMQDRLGDIERENSEYYEAAVRQARQASSDSRLVWSYRGSKARTHAASPSADSVRSMPAQHLYWRQSSVSSLEHQHHGEPAADERTMEKGVSQALSAQSPWTEITSVPDSDKPADKPSTPSHSVSIETEFPANNGSPKSTRRSLDRHPSSGSLDSAYHSRGFVKHNGKDVRYQRSVSAEALRDFKVTMRPKHDLTLPLLPKSNTAPSMRDDSNMIHHQAEVHNELSPGSTIAPSASGLTDSGVVNDPFADDADDILSKHQSLIVGSMEDLFGAMSSDVRDYVIHEEDSPATNSGRSTQEKPTPPPRPHSRCLSDGSYSNEVPEPTQSGDGGPPPLPPKQYKGSRRPYKPLPAEPPPDPRPEDEDSSDKNTDSESIKQELTALTSQIARMASSTHH